MTEVQGLVEKVLNALLGMWRLNQKNMAYGCFHSRNGAAR